jgi:hypothetical protein
MISTIDRSCDVSGDDVDVDVEGIIVGFSSTTRPVLIIIAAADIIWMMGCHTIIIFTFLVLVDERFLAWY